MRSCATVLAVCLLAATVVADNPTHEGKDAPPLMFVDLLHDDVGYTDVASLRGDVVVLTYYRTSCPGCRGILPALQSAFEKYERPDVHILAATNDSRQLTLRYLHHEAVGTKLRFPIAIKSRGDWGVTGVPMTYVIGRDGIVRWGGKTGGNFEDALAAALAEPDPDRPEHKKARSVAARLTKEQYARALADVEKSGSKELLAWASMCIARRFVRSKALAMRHLDSGDAWAAEMTLLEMADRFEDTPLAPEIETMLAQARSNERAAMRKAFGEFHAIASAARGGGKSTLARAAAKLKALIGKNAGTPVEAPAEELLRAVKNPWTQEDAAEFGAGCAAGD